MKKYIMILCSGIVLAIAIPTSFLSFRAFRGPCIDAENASQFGDFIGGYLGTIFAFISMILIFVTFMQQRDADKENSLSQYIEKFENKFFNMIHIHRDNVMEIMIGNASGKKSFVVLFREFRLIIDLLDKYFIDNRIEMEIKDKYNLAYCIFVYGVGPNSSRILKCALRKYDKTLINSIVKIIEKKETRSKARRVRKLKYVPFEGHQSRLGHYFRHLFQTVSYVDSQELLSFEEKYKYVKILRAQLTNHEQAFLFLNSISDFGRKWCENGLITKYRLIKNLPEEFFDKVREIDVKKLYPDLLFEWEEM